MDKDADANDAYEPRLGNRARKQLEVRIRPRQCGALQHEEERGEALSQRQGSVAPPLSAELL